MSGLIFLCWFHYEKMMNSSHFLQLLNRVIVPMIIFLYLAERLTNMTYEQRLLNHLLKDFKNRKLVRPVINSTKPVIVRLSAQLLGVAKVDEKEQLLKTHFWIRQDWANPFMTWKPADYGGVKQINIPPEMLWVPDVILYNK